jgi:histidine triad (HIT) family protein
MFDDQCVFCQIAQNKISAQKIMENEDLFAINDISPKTPIHILIIPKTHIPSINDLKTDNQTLIGKLFTAAREISKQKKLSEGYRLVINTGPHAGQTVHHLHLHLLGGQQMESMV